MQLLLHILVDRIVLTSLDTSATDALAHQCSAILPIRMLRTFTVLLVDTPRPARTAVLLRVLVIFAVVVFGCG